MSVKFQKPRGTIDILPKDIPVWHKIENTARQICKKFGFEEIRFPTFEQIDLFQRGVGNTTDVVQKEMYSFSDKEGRQFALRPEGTACIVRSIIENGKCSDAMPLKLYYLINCFRYEKPQAGRSREFYQFGTELFGAESAAADAEIISLAYELINALEIRGIRLHINSIGCHACRPLYHDALKQYFEARKDSLCETCRERLEKNPLRILDCKNPECAAIADAAPKTTEHLCQDCSNHMEELKQALTVLRIPYQIDPKIVRGLDYYTRTVFEFIAEGIGAQSTICGGGRYDGLVRELGGPALSGIGFAMGITRLIEAMAQSGVQQVPSERPLLYIASVGSAAVLRALAIVQRLRAEGIWAECDIVGRSLKAQMKYADKTGAVYTLVLGDEEIDKGSGILKHMVSGEQTEVELDTFLPDKSRS